jgi:hypothetical protein
MSSGEFSFEPLDIAFASFGEACKRRQYAHRRVAIDTAKVRAGRWRTKQSSASRTKFAQGSAR